MKKDYIFGLDIGISSVGWGLLELDDNNNPYKIIDVGSRIFTPGEVEKTGDSRAKERREKRGARRIARRREFRLDRVKNLLYENGYLKGNINSNIVSEKNEELSIIFNNMINNYYNGKNINPYILKVEALDRKLTDEELSIILVHYAKKRGYKSNREEASDKESGKVLTAIKENEKIMKDNNYRTISEMYIKDDKFKNKIKNSPNDYKISVTNEMYLEEINKVLDSQIKFGLITDNFKNQYLEIYNSRRSYAKGPGGNSPYGGDLIERMTGKCNFDGNPRAPKRAFSSEIYVALTKLVNLKYKVNDGEYIKLSEKEIKNIIEKAKEKKSISYKDLTKMIGNNIDFKDLTLSKKEYIKLIEELKKKLNIKKDTKININELSSEDKELYNKLYNDKLLSKTLIELKGYHTLKDSVIKAYSKDIWDEVKDRLNKSALGLSGGQQQRLCIARALAVQPEVLLMDEPTSALDPISTSKIEDLALELKKNYTIIMVTHNMQQAARISDKTAFFLLGEVIEYGSTETLFSIPSDKRTEDYITGRFG